MADVRRQKDLLGRLSGDVELGIRQMARLERCIDADVVLVVAEGVELLLGEAEPPHLPVVGRAVRNPVRVLGKGESVSPQLSRGYPGANRHAVSDDVKW